MARSFNGTTDKILGTGVKNVLFTATPGFSVSGWVNLASFSSGFQTIVSKGTASNRQFFIGVQPTVSPFGGGQTNALLYIANTNASAGGVNTTAAISTSKWYFFCLSLGSSSAAPNFFVWDSLGAGLLATTNLQTVWGPDADSAANDLWIGQEDPADGLFINASIADIALWRVPLTQSEATQLAYGIRRPGDIRPSALIAWYPFREHGTSLAQDLSGNGHIGINTGTAYVNDPLFLVAPRVPQFKLRTPVPPPSGPSVTTTLTNKSADGKWFSRKDYWAVINGLISERARAERAERRYQFIANYEATPEREMKLAQRAVFRAERDLRSQFNRKLFDADEEAKETLKALQEKETARLAKEARAKSIEAAKEDVRKKVKDAIAKRRGK